MSSSGHLITNRQTPWKLLVHFVLLCRYISLLAFVISPCYTNLPQLHESRFFFAFCSSWLTFYFSFPFPCFSLPNHSSCNFLWSLCFTHYASHNFGKSMFFVSSSFFFVASSFSLLYPCFTALKQNIIQISDVSIICTMLTLEQISLESKKCFEYLSFIW